jgi:hypothetical protein
MSGDSDVRGSTRGSAMKTYRRVLLAAAVVAVVALAGVLDSRGAIADDRVVQVAIDVDVAGNESNVLGTTEDCNTAPIAVGETFDVDVVVRDIPEYVPSDPPGVNPKGGVAAVEFDLIFDPSVVHVVSVQGFDGPSILAADGAYLPTVFADYDNTENDIRQPPPGVTGNVRIALVDASLEFESGSGVATRVTLQAVGSGVSRLELQTGYLQKRAPSVYASDTTEYQVTSSNATIAVGASCPTGTPGPFPTASPNGPPDRTPAPPTAAGTFDIRVEPATVEVGQDVTLNIRADIGTPGMGSFFVQLNLVNATFISCSSDFTCEDHTHESDTVDIAEQRGHLRTGDIHIAAVTVQVNGPGIVAQFGELALRDYNGAPLEPLTVSNRYVTTSGVTPPPTPSPTPTLAPSSTATQTAIVSPTSTATATPLITPGDFPRGGGMSANGRGLALISVGAGVAALGAGFWLARRRLG